MITKGDWIKQGSFIFSSEKPPRLIAEFIRSNMSLPEQQGNALITCVAVNACQKINPENPRAVAENIEEAIGALKLYRSHQEGTSGHYCWECAEAINKVLSKIESKEVSG